MTIHRLPAAWAGWLALSLTASTAFPAVLRVGPDKTYRTVRAAAQAARDGDTIEIDAGTYRQDVATWRANNLTIRGVGAGRAHLVADGVNEGGKGIWVIQGANTTIENIEFSGASVPDHNGAGIRAEHTGSLTVRNCYFHDNEDGILTSNDPSVELVVENSIFERSGYGDGYSHNIYVGRIRSFRFQCSYSHLARGGHNVKSRARTNHILYNRIMDEETGNASYQVDLPEGGVSFLIGNIIQKGPKAENSALLSYALENTNAGSLDLYVVNNTMVNEGMVDGRPRQGPFLQLRSGTRAAVVNNILAGPGALWSTDGVTVTADHNFVDPTRNNSARLADPSKFDYHLLPDSPCRDAGAALQPLDGFSLAPSSQYAVDARCETRRVDGRLDVGAYEYKSVSEPVFFPQVVRGGGFSTVFNIMNVGSGTAVGSLRLFDDTGTDTTSFPFSIPSGGTGRFTAASTGTGESLKKGWAVIESDGGTLQGAATFQLEDKGALVATVGVLGSQSVAVAAIPVDNDDSVSRFVGFAIANSGPDPVNVTLTTLDEQGSLLDTLNPAELNPLGARTQVARFLHEYLPSRSKFRGSMVLRAADGGKFVAVALVQNQGRYTAIPVLP